MDLWYRYAVTRPGPAGTPNGPAFPLLTEAEHLVLHIYMLAASVAKTVSHLQEHFHANV